MPVDTVVPAVSMGQTCRRLALRVGTVHVDETALGVPHACGRVRSGCNGCHTSHRWRHWGCVGGFRSDAIVCTLVGSSGALVAHVKTPGTDGGPPNVRHGWAGGWVRQSLARWSAPCSW